VSHAVREARGEVVRVAKQLRERGLAVGTSGNVGIRLDDGRIAITPSSMEYDELTVEDIVIVEADGSPSEGRRSPSSELPLHVGVFAARPDVRAIVHSHSPFAKTFAIADHYHCSLLGPTWPNRVYLYSATSFGKTSNVFPDLTTYVFPDNDSSIFDELEKRHVDWNVYYKDEPGIAILYATAITARLADGMAHAGRLRGGADPTGRGARPAWPRRGGTRGRSRRRHRRATGRPGPDRRMGPSRATC